MNQPANSIRTQAAMLSEVPTLTKVLVASIDASLARARAHADRIEAELSKKDTTNG